VQLIVRATGKNLRANYLDEIVVPLALPKDQTDIMTKHLFKDPSDPDANRAAFYVRLPPSSEGGNAAPAFMHIPLPVYEPPTDDPPAGFAHFASACVHASLPVYARILQAALSHDQRLLSEKTWSLAEADSTTPVGSSVPYPNMQTFMPDLSYPIDHFFDVDASSQTGNVDETSGINLFQAHTTRVKVGHVVDTLPSTLDSLCLSLHLQTGSGLAPGSYSWAGLANTYWFIDPASGVGGVFGTQLLPFYDPKMIEARYEWEKLITSTLK
jgi:CubicO group peptidase (beta-lactamase class C family)